VVILTIGNFDGVHLGHKKLIEKCVELAHPHRWDISCIFFDPPAKLFFKKTEVSILTLAEKVLLLKKYGVTHVYPTSFNKTVCNLTALEFIEQYILTINNLKVLHVGEDFRFGKNRQGNVKFLEDNLTHKGIIISTLKLDNKKIYSSSAIREALKYGDINKVNRALGYKFFIHGKIKSTNLYYEFIPNKKSCLPDGKYEVYAKLGGYKKQAITMHNCLLRITNNNYIFLKQSMSLCLNDGTEITIYFK
jgi:riboflavin kinase / FMN adenylyltransferase